MASSSSEIVVYFCFRVEMHGQRALRALRTPHRFWYLISREIERLTHMGAAARQKGKKAERTCLNAQVVGRVAPAAGGGGDDGGAATAAKVRLSTLRGAIAVVPFLESGSTLEDGDIIVLQRTPSSMFRLEQSRLWHAWQEYCRTHAVPPSDTLEHGAHLALRYGVPDAYAHLVRAVQHNFDVGAQARRRDAAEAGSDAPAPVPAAVVSAPANGALAFADNISDEQRIALVAGAGARLFDAGRSSSSSSSSASTPSATSHGDARHSSGRGGAGARKHSRYPPRTYLCQRCKVPGHWLSDCPTHGDAAYDTVRTVKATGIPKALLQRVAADDVEKRDVVMMMQGDVACKFVDRSERFRRLVGVDGTGRRHGGSSGGDGNVENGDDDDDDESHDDESQDDEAMLPDVKRIKYSA